MEAVLWLLLAWCLNFLLGSGPPASGPRCCWSVGASGAPGHSSQREAARTGSAQPGRSTPFYG